LAVGSVRALEAPPTIVGRYLLASEIASGGMGSVYLGRVRGAVGFSRVVAIKRLHPLLARDPAIVAMFVDEARMAARIHHANVVPTLDVVSDAGELCLVMEYVNGESLSRLLERAVSRTTAIPRDVAIAIAVGALHGLHAAHEARNERNEPLHIVHRDVSPQNILLGADGIARVVDFGVAKARGRLQTTSDGSIKGKCAYMAPEQLRSDEVDRRADIFALGVVFWELLTQRRLFAAENQAASITKALYAEIPPPSALRPDVPLDLDRIVLGALHRERDHRYATALEMALAIEACGVELASVTRVAEWIRSFAGDLQATAPVSGVVSAPAPDTGLNPNRIPIPASAPTSGGAGMLTMSAVHVDPIAATHAAIRVAPTGTPEKSGDVGPVDLGPSVVQERSRLRAPVLALAIGLGIVLAAIGIRRGTAHAPVSGSSPSTTLASTASVPSVQPLASAAPSSTPAPATSASIRTVVAADSAPSAARAGVGRPPSPRKTTTDGSSRLRAAPRASEPDPYALSH
jgi:eukaryotic-like serine/threonine-protein kinase